MLTINKDHRQQVIIFGGMMRIFFDTEFTGLHQDTRLISIGLVDEDGEKFYAESSECMNGHIPPSDREWVWENIVPQLIFFGKSHEGRYRTSTPHTVEVYGPDKQIAMDLAVWLSKYDKVELWSDCLAYDFMLFNQLWGHAFKIPKNVYYIPFDICTVFKMKGIDPDINREEFSCLTDGAKKHNSLWDAEVIKACYEKLMQYKEKTP